MDQQLLVFVTVVEKQNFSRAAETLHMTQPAVSQHIQMLERSVGTKLLNRSNKYVHLNKAGEIVYHHAKEILGLYTKMRNLVDDLTNTATGELSIGASYTFGEYVLPHIIARLREQFPLIKPTITIGNTYEIEELMTNNQIDVGIVEGEIKSKKLHVEDIAEDFMSIIVSGKHPFAMHKDLTLQDLQNETWIVREKGSGTREATDGMFEKFQFSPKDMMEFGSTQIIKESVEAGLGVSLLSHWAIHKELKLEKLAILKIQGFPIIRKFSLVTPSTKFQTKASEVFVTLLKDKEGYNII
ncbi:LysR family transcriptional regulator [Lysinibacillus endophyticus]|uniref:LysR family transcriptional regulator n=1 Tax=Ureibacillus endophyticus TaxID=1978490 RepID=A0A494YUN9_9BACL|nr:LysR family transcriptional regulator [Lysinibacillus endophyticus]RKQ13862.1 LysR family transcriptional regulator [Lysinibacillus endophyticus]